MSFQRTQQRLEQEKQGKEKPKEESVKKGLSGANSDVSESGVSTDAESKATNTSEVDSDDDCEVQAGRDNMTAESRMKFAWTAESLQVREAAAKMAELLKSVPARYLMTHEQRMRTIHTNESQIVREIIEEMDTLIKNNKDIKTGRPISPTCR